MAGGRGGPLVGGAQVGMRLYAKPLNEALDIDLGLFASGSGIRR
jgi:hypothetical protein